MKTRILFLSILAVLFLQTNCSFFNRNGKDDLRYFTKKADLKTQQLYQTFQVESQTDTTLALFIHCSEFAEREQHQLEQLNAKINSQSGDILTIECPVGNLPALSRLDFITSIEAAKKARFK